MRKPEKWETIMLGIIERTPAIMYLPIFEMFFDLPIIPAAILSVLAADLTFQASNYLISVLLGMDINFPVNAMVPEELSSPLTDIIIIDQVGPKHFSLYRTD